MRTFIHDRLVSDEAPSAGPCSENYSGEWAQMPPPRRRPWSDHWVLIRHAGWPRSSSRWLLRFQGHFVAKLLQAFHQTPCQALRVQLVEVVRSQVVVGGAVL